MPVRSARLPGRRQTHRSRSFCRLAWSCRTSRVVVWPFPRIHSRDHQGVQRSATTSRRAHQVLRPSFAQLNPRKVFGGMWHIDMLIKAENRRIVLRSLEAVRVQRCSFRRGFFNIGERSGAVRKRQLPRNPACSLRSISDPDNRNGDRGDKFSAHGIANFQTAE